jgi:hypothetical protein
MTELPPPAPPAPTSQFGHALAVTTKLPPFILAVLVVLSVGLVAGCGGSTEGAISPEEEEQIVKEYEETDEPQPQAEVEAEIKELDVERCYAEAKTEAEELPCVEMDDELSEAE